ncbi:MAG: Vms1/Ankzf1 family peptidyl-tRNA hydrolase [Chloroflexota bacterium]
MSTVRRYNLTKVRLLHLLEELKADSIEVGSLCVPPGFSQTNIQSMMETILNVKKTPEDLSISLAQSQTGGILFWGPHHKYLVMPPFPVMKESVSNTCDIEPLLSLMHRGLLFGLIVVRLGEYGIGVVQGEKLLSSKVGTGLVHSRHRQGGSSSHRFERHREKQVETFFTRVCQHAREQLEPYARQLDYVLYGGTRETILDFRKQCHFLHDFDKITLARLLNIREPKQSRLVEGIQEAWSSKVIQWN